METMLKIKNLTVNIDKKEVIKNLSLRLQKGKIHALAGPNGSGKTSLCFSIMGHPDYKISGGEILLDNENITPLSTEEKAKLGIFLSFQEPPEISGVGVYSFLMTMIAKQGQKHAFAALNEAKEIVRSLGLEQSFLDRNLNEGFSGGEKKKCELLQLAVSEPRVAILDEIDAGLDADALKTAVKIIKKAAENGTAVLIISHSPRIFKMLKPDFAHIMIDGKIIKSGDAKLLKQIENGYQKIKTK